MGLFNINARYARSVRLAIKSASFMGPWEIMPVAPGDPQEQLWVQDDHDAARLGLLLPFEALTRVTHWN